tara:strand:- start:65 stop:439 length:375 start_codon:yes stop_codon:yes gene_type:complete
MLKNKNKLLTISKVALKIGLVNKKSKKPLTHTLRFWETQFKQLNPTVLAGGRRYYSSKDLDVIKLIFYLLKEQGLTLNGAKKAMNENLNKLDATKSSSIKAEYYKKLIKLKSINILKKIKKLNG